MDLVELIVLFKKKNIILILIFFIDQNQPI